ncbi:MAG: hypothetical protein O2820_09760 [Planctomycetota bacterium]|nr:hypothetical protein [Planctomycetota bacterium]MDA1249499.1 hypothetical protein [Planctomycetota bacterium]
MPERQVIVFENRPRWAPALQREFVESGIRVRACRTAQALLSLATACRDHSDSFVAIIDFEVGPATCLPLPARLAEFSPQGVIALGTAETDVLEPSLRELGVTSYHPASIESRRLAHECQRILNSQHG